MHYHNEDKNTWGWSQSLKNNIKYKVRKDVISVDVNLEHLWLEIEGKKIHSKLLLSVAYQSSLTVQENNKWLKSFDKVIGAAASDWSDIIVITADFNIDLLTNSNIKDLLDLELLQSYDLIQQLAIPTWKKRYRPK